MAKNEAHASIESYLAAKNLKHSRPRQEIIDTFIKADSHLTAEELYHLVKKKNPKIGFATVYRTLKLMCESGLCKELKFEKSGDCTRYEILKGREHHDHLICTHCGTVVEVFDAELERMQNRLFKLHDFYPQSHRLELYGTCKTCRKRGRGKVSGG
ncbi:transcriptional repressor [candidate division FCPU426 bacterium]|nr:transcriptional repressor [candidate division FCPU426 bacterium]